MKQLHPDAIRYMDYLSFKMDCAREQEANPVTVDLVKAQEHLTELEKQRDEKYIQLRMSMPKVPVMETKEYPKKPLKQDGSMSAQGIKWQSLLSELNLPLDTTSPVTYVKEYEEPNPQSDVQIKKWLYDLGWEPRHFKFDRNKVTGEEKQIPQIRYLKGHPQEGELCDEILELAEKDPAVETLAGLSIIKHRIGFFTGYLTDAKADKVVASIEGLTNTLRFKHRKPLANIPGVDKPWGKEIRGCIVAPQGKVLCGSDMTALENRTGDHYIKPLDPDYVGQKSDPNYDPHVEMCVIAGLMTEDELEFFKWFKQKS